MADVTSTLIEQAKQFQSLASTGTAPLVVASTTKVTNLNADKLDDQEGSYYSNAANLTGTVASARLSGAYTGITTVGTLTSLTVTGTVDALNGINLGAGGAQGIISWGGAGPYLRGAAGKGSGLYGGGAANGITVDSSGNASLSAALSVSGIVTLTGLPTADPAVTGRLWNSSGTLKISA